MPQDANEIDLERLDAFLSSEDSPDDSLILSDLDGFLHGIACSPVMISSHEWMPMVLGGAADTVPEWVLEDIASLYMKICDGLISEHPQIEPIFWQAKEGHVIAMDWCEGFMMAVKLRPDPWQVFMDTREGAELMNPIVVHMLDENGNSLLGLVQEELDDALGQAAESIPMAVAAIFKLLAPTRLH